MPSRSRRLSRRQTRSASTDLDLVLPVSSDRPTSDRRRRRRRRRLGQADSNCDCNVSNADSCHAQLDVDQLAQEPRQTPPAVPRRLRVRHRRMATCLTALAWGLAGVETAMAVADVTLGITMLISSNGAFRCTTQMSVITLASSAASILFVISIIITHYLATGNVIVHSCMKFCLMIISLINTFATLPRLRQTRLSISTCSSESVIALTLAAGAKTVVLIFMGVYFYLVTYFVAQFGEDNRVPDAGWDESNKHARNVC